MPLRIVKVPVSCLEWDGPRSPDGLMIYDQRKYFCSRSKHIPPILCGSDGENLSVRGLGVYLHIAKDLGVECIHAIVLDDVSAEVVEKAGGRFLTENEMREREYPDENVLRWHIFFFCRELSERESEGFSDLISRSFDDIFEKLGCRIKRGDIEFKEGGRVAEFLANPPIIDGSWILLFREYLREFHENVVEIESYQGMKFFDVQPP